MIGKEKRKKRESEEEEEERLVGRFQQKVMGVGSLVSYFSFQKDAEPPPSSNKATFSCVKHVSDRTWKHPLANTVKSFNHRIESDEL